MLNKYTNTITKPSRGYWVTYPGPRGHILGILPITTWPDLGGPYGQTKPEAGGALQVLHARIYPDTLSDLIGFHEVSNRYPDPEKRIESFHTVPTCEECPSNANQESFRKVLGRCLDTMEEARKGLLLHWSKKMLNPKVEQAISDYELEQQTKFNSEYYGQGHSQLLKTVRPTPKRKEYRPVTLIVPK